MEGQGINGLVIGSSQVNPNSVPVKTINASTWTSVIWRRLSQPNISYKEIDKWHTFKNIICTYKPALPAPRNDVAY